MTGSEKNLRNVDLALEKFRTQEFRGDGDTLFVAGTLMEYCVTDSRVTWEHGYRFLDFPGVIAEFGARILYIKTGRDKNIDEFGALERGGTFSSDKTDWREYLLANGYNIHN